MKAHRDSEDAIITDSITLFKFHLYHIVIARVAENIYGKEQYIFTKGHYILYIGGSNAGLSKQEK